MVETVDVVVIGAGQAGLATSYHLTQAGIDHVVLEREQVAQSWRSRWDSFHLVIPNWTLQLPGHPYRGDDPDGFLPRDEIVSYLETYASLIPAPLREGVGVTGLAPGPGGWKIETSNGQVATRAVVVATGAFQESHRPHGLIPESIHQYDIAGYRNPADIPPGKILVIGSGQSGCQIAEDLLRAGRDVFLACGRAPWLPRRVGGRDIFWWLNESGFMDVPVDALSDPRERLGANPQLTGRDGGHDLHFRTLQENGATLLGRFSGIEGEMAHFADDLGISVAFGDQAYRQLSEVVKRVAGEHGAMVEDDLPDPPPWSADTPETVDLSDFGAVVFATGFRPAYSSWIDLPDAFDALGFPIQDDRGGGAHRGLHFVGVHFLRNRRSALFPGVGDDAAVVVSHIADQLR